MSAPITTDVRRAAQVLRAGGLVAFPTETVYGLGADALDPRAVAKVFEAKGRPAFDPLIVHVADRSQVAKLVSAIPERAQLLMDRFWPGPLTLVLPKRDIVPDLVTAGLPHVGVRIPSHRLALEFLRACGTPVAAPSANPFGGISPTTAEHVRHGLGERIDLILDGGPCAVGLESTVLQVSDDAPPRVLRAGGLTVEEIESVVGPVARTAGSTSHPGEAQPAPGMLSRHYAPRVSIEFPNDWNKVPTGSDVGVLTFREVLRPDRFGHVETLSPTGDLKEAAANFFAALRRLDAAPIGIILAEWFPESGLGIPLNDRLRRASAP